ncbi:MAG: lamin tail domain-containing protein [Verrucomicrobiales bacterium]
MIIQRALFWALCAVLSAAPACAQSVFISEFMASNRDSLDDADGESSDWIELFNASDRPVDLDGWHLSDDPSNLTMWRFPGVTIGAGGFMVIFASDKNLRDPDGQLHTNFKLTSSGEYLALIRADGITVAHEYAPSYPAQVTDVSYGLSMGRSESVLLDLGASLKWKIPVNDDDDVSAGDNPDPWTGNFFNDASWESGNSGAGYARSEPDPYDSFIRTDLENQLDGGNTGLYLRFAFELDDPSAVTGLTLRMRYDDGFVAFLNGQPEPVASANAPPADNLSWNSTATANQPDGDAVEYEDFVISDPPLVAGRNILAIHALNTSSSSSDLLAQPQLVGAELTTLGAEENYSVTPTPGGLNVLGGIPGPLLRNVTAGVDPIDVGGAPSRVKADSIAEFSGVQGRDGWRYGYHQGSGAYNAATDFIAFRGGDGQGSWNDSSQHWTGSIWDLQTAATSPWTSIGSSSVHPNDSNPGPRHAVVRRWTSDVSGVHTISGHFNNVSGSGDGTTGRIFHNNSEIFSAITDGNTRTVNLQVVLSQGDTVDFYVDVGPSESDGSDGTNTGFLIVEGAANGNAIALPVTAEVDATMNPIASVVLRYRIMFEAEAEVVMVDDGTGDDQVADDNIYTATIRSGDLSAGEMLRWRVVATDTAGNGTTDPRFTDPLDSPRYHGTIASDPSVDTSLLPVMYWFVANAGAANNRSGTRGSLFFEGELYDNILTDLHGQSTSGFSKKSYDFDFNSGERFRWQQGEKRVKDLNLLTNWADKAKVRNAMGYALSALMGEPCHYAKMVRVQQNGSFFAVADMVEDGDDRYLDRVGLDGQGALYKMYNRLDSTSGASKKTRKDEGSSDLQALINGLGRSGDAKLRYGYDNIDIPGTINYLVSMVLINNRDHGHKNYYLYRDTEGSGEWRPLIWDLDLNLGRNWRSGAGYFDDAFTVNGITAGPSNRLKTLIYDDGQLWAMFLRRLKTVVDAIIEPEGTPSPLIEGMLNDFLDTVDPQGVVSDADLDYNKWGSWGNRNRAAQAAARIRNEFLPSFRRHFFTGLAGTLPGSQPAMAPVDIAMGEFNPVSGNQDEEYFTLFNANGYAVDLSGWRIDGAVRMDFAPGTVIAPGMTLYVGRDATAFRGREISPKGGEKRFLTSGYGGQLSARGETIELYDGSDNLIESFTYGGEPTAMQQWLRITEIHYHPLDATAGEQAINSDWSSSDFEFVELTNVGDLELDISGAQLVAGINFIFPPESTLPAGASVLVVGNKAAFEARYGTGLNVAGEYTGQLDNGGEEIQLHDNVGENILEFNYDDEWHRETDGTGHSLQITEDALLPDDWRLSSAWRPSFIVGGTPGSGGDGNMVSFRTWKQQYYSAAEADDASISGPGADSDGDLRPTLMEYALGTSPVFAGTGNSPDAFILDVGGEQYLAMRFTRQKHAIDLVYNVEVGGDLKVWENATVTVGLPVDNGDGSEILIIRDTQVFTGGSQRFIRLSVNLVE